MSLVRSLEERSCFLKGISIDSFFLSASMGETLRCSGAEGSKLSKDPVIIIR